jgi:hypothetical protein
MVKKWWIAGVIIAFVVVLYVIEFSKIEINPGDTYLSLDNLETLESDQQWAPFYRVRAEIIDGQSAKFKIPKELLKAEGKEMELTGAAMFFSNGCYAHGDSIAVQSMLLLPTLGLANACVHLPEVAMRWTILVNMKEDWLITRSDMIQSVVTVKGIFRIDTEKPYDAAFHMDQASARLIVNKEGTY